MEYKFEWNYKKAYKNKRKHNINFRRAATVFDDPYMLTIFDDKHSDNEDRWITLGADQNGILLIVSHTFYKISMMQYNIRIISARKATNNEKKEYEVGL